MTQMNTMDKINKFRDDRDWRQFHNEKDLAISISLEAAELLELFQWKYPEEVRETSIERIKEELADVLIYSHMLASRRRGAVRRPPGARALRVVADAHRRPALAAGVFGRWRRDLGGELGDGVCTACVIVVSPQHQAQKWETQQPLPPDGRVLPATPRGAGTHAA